MIVVIVDTALVIYSLIVSTNGAVSDGAIIRLVLLHHGPDALIRNLPRGKLML